MSSHHIVRDEQEPALLLADPDLLTCPWLGDLLEWSPVVLVLEQALDKALSLGFKMDIVCCRPKNVAQISEKVAHQYPIEVVSMEKLSIEAALQLLGNRKHSAINIATQAQADQLDLTNTIYHQVDVVIYQQASRIIQSTKQFFEKWLNKGTLLSVYAGEANIGQNLKSLSNKQFEVLNDGLVNLKGTQDFWLKEPL